MASRLDNPAGFLAELAARLPAASLVTGDDRLAPHLTEWRGLFRGQALAMVLPETTEQAAEVVRLCAGHGVGIVPQGGNTGLVGGAIPHSTPERPQIILGAARLNRVLELDADNYALTAQSGCLLAGLQEAAAAADRVFPLSLAAEGSCQLGGNIATNAGGINVLRYGTMRDQVLGLEVVLADGRVLDTLRGLRKDNTGYDLKQLFIGAEGTLGFITAATCKLYPRPASRATAWLAVADPGAAISLYARARAALGDELVAFELISRTALDMVVAHIDGCRDPLGSASAWQLLIELAASTQDAQQRVEQFLAAELELGGLQDAVIAQSDAQAASLWRVRHSISEAQKLAGAGIKHDVSVPVSRVDQFLARASAAALDEVPGCRIVAFGHIGDGNLHFNLNQPDDWSREAFLGHWDSLSGRVHEIAHALGGSFSAEHGVGSLKTGELERFRGGVELEVMRSIKQALDPEGIMNPGKLLPPTAA